MPSIDRMVFKDELESTGRPFYRIPEKKQLYRIETLQPKGHLVTAAVLIDVLLLHMRKGFILPFRAAIIACSFLCSLLVLYLSVI